MSSQGNTMTGTGSDTQGRPVPTEPVRSGAPRDPFEALEQARARQAIRSPIVLKDPPDPPARRPAAADRRFHAPPPDDDEEPAPAPTVDTHASTSDEQRAQGLDELGQLVDRLVDLAGHTAAAAATAREILDLIRPPASAPPPPARRRVRGKSAHRTLAEGRKPRGTVDVERIIRLYTAGRTCPQIAAELDLSVSTVRRHVDQAADAGRVQQRDGRGGNGGHNRIDLDAYPAEEVARLCRLYVEEQLTLKQVAARTGTDERRIRKVLVRYGVTLRPAAALPVNNVGARKAVERKRRVEAAGGTLAQVRAWALERGLAVADRGVPSEHVVDLWLAEHVGHEADG